MGGNKNKLMARQRNRIDLFTKEEKAIWDVNQMIENMPHAHPLLTECQILLDKAKDKLSDWVDTTQNGETNG